MIVFLDVEASSLTLRGYPVEVGWATVDRSTGIDTVESHLVKPTAPWHEYGDWDEASAQVHRIPQADLEAHGKTVDEVCRILMNQFAGVNIYTDAPNFDARWLGILFGAWNGDNLVVPSDQLPLRVFDASILFMPPMFSREAIIHSEREMADVPVTHRAGDDARRLALQFVAAEAFDTEHRADRHTL